MLNELENVVKTIPLNHCTICELLQELADKMLEMITIVSVDIQREIITCLPEVVEDSEHSHVATSLR
jgi:NCAIR mutase (PurE)-related protein